MDRNPSFKQTMANDSYQLFVPDHLTVPIVFASPHSGRNYTASFVENADLPLPLLRSSEDAFVHDLFGRVTEFGIPLLAAKAPRALIDLNRDVDELDPSLIEGLNPNNTTARVAAGLGVIPKVVANSKVIRKGKISLQDAQDRISRYYRPYHAQLRHLLDDCRRHFGWSFLVDCHSMPTASTDRMDGEKPDIVLGTRYGASCTSDLVCKVEEICKKIGFNVAIDTPFAGAYSLEEYGKPAMGQHAIQIEIDRSLYMDEANVQKHENYWNLRSQLTDFARLIAQIDYKDLRLAAE